MTRKIRVLVACLIAALAATAAISAIASAEMVLPVFSGTDASATGSSGEGTLRIAGAASIKCTSSGSDKLTFETGKRNLGPGTIIFSGCTEGGEECRSLGGTLGTIETTGSWHLVLNGGSGAGDIHLFLFLLTLLHIECPKGVVKLFLVLGNVAGKIVQKAGTKELFELSVGTVNNEGKVQNFSEYENDAGTGIKTTLETIEEGTGKPKTSAEESFANDLNFELTTSIEK
jgi:hypothetical protein